MPRIWRVRAKGTDALFGKKGLVGDEQPDVESPVVDFMAYHFRKGRHDVTDYDWIHYLAFAKRQFSK
jgi:hypothetical protein